MQQELILVIFLLEWNLAHLEAEVDKIDVENLL